MALTKDSTSSKSLVLIAFVLAIAALYFGRPVFIPLALALVFSFLLTPLVSLLEKIRFSRVPAVLTVLALSFALIGTVSWGMAGQLVEIMVHIPDYKDNLDAKIQALHPSTDGNLSKATATVHELNKELAAVPDAISSGNKRAETGRPVHTVPVQVTAPPANLFQDLRALLGPLAGPIETSVIAIIFTLFMLVKREDLRNRAIRLAGRSQLNLMTQALDDAGRRLSRYLFLQFLVNTSYGLLFGGALYFIGVPHSRLWGLCAGLLRFVPYAGTLIAAVFPTAMALAVFPGWHHAALTFAVFVVLELVIGNVLEPLLYGAHTGISSLAILVAAVFWAMLWGPVGLILSTPLTVCLMVLGRYVPQLSFLEIVLGDEPVLPPEQQFYQRLLAMDQDEARTIAEAHLKENPLESLYESVLIPALRLAEQDHYVDGLDDKTKVFMFQSTMELIEDLEDRIEENASDGKCIDDKHAASPAQPSLIRIACIPSKEGADELVASMLAQVLRHAGYRAREFRTAGVEDMLAEVARERFSIVCLSALPPYSITHARLLCKRLKAARPELQIVVGLWSLAEGADRGRERLGPGCAAAVTTTLSDALVQVRHLVATENLDIDANSRSLSDV